MSDLLRNLLTGVWGSPQAIVLFGLLILTAMHAAVALGRSRQWYILPVVFGLTAVTGFLLNPLADSHTPSDLQADLTNIETLTGICILQFLLACASVRLGLRMDGGCNPDRSSVRLAAVSAIPPPFLVVAMLLLEQLCLTTFAGARPEAVGRMVGMSVAGLLILAGGLCMCLPPRWLAVPHAVLAGATAVGGIFVPLLQDPLPQSIAAIDWESLRLLVRVMPIPAAIILLGYGWSNVRSRRRSVGKSPGTTSVSARIGAARTGAQYPDGDLARRSTS